MCVKVPRCRGVRGGSQREEEANGAETRISAVSVDERGRDAYGSSRTTSVTRAVGEDDRGIPKADPELLYVGLDGEAIRRREGRRDVKGVPGQTLIRYLVQNKMYQTDNLYGVGRLDVADKRPVSVCLHRGRSVVTAQWCHSMRER